MQRQRRPVQAALLQDHELLFQQRRLLLRFHLLGNALYTEGGQVETLTL